MKILILGADGMMGHQLVESWRGCHALVGTVRLHPAAYSPIAEYLPDDIRYGLDVRHAGSVETLIETERPDVVINAIGIVKQRKESKEAISSIETNALLPHRLAMASRRIGARLVHFGTDCVFSGARGRYTEQDFPDADDLYGRTKLLGEVDDAGSITLRTSIIGLELSRKKSLVEWFLEQKDPIKGYRRAIYSGFTTLEMARIIEHVLVRYPDLSGVYHVSSEPIDKYTLLCKLRDRLRLDVEIVPDDEFNCDRSLSSSRFRQDFLYQPPTWDTMLDELAQQIEMRRT